jgi:tricorn protease-like protein
MKGGKKGKPIIAGKPAESLLYRLASRAEKKFMPPETEDPLTPEELATIRKWIEEGAKGPTGGRKTGPKVIVGVPPANVHPVRALAVSPDRSTVVASRGNRIHVYDATSGAHVRELIDPDLTTADQKKVKAAHLSLVESIACSPDGKYIASGSFQEILLWDAQTGKIKHRITGLADRVVALAFSPNSKLLAEGGGVPTQDGEVKVYSVPTCKLYCEIKDPKNGHSDTVFGVCFSPDSTKLATCGADKFVKAWQLPTGKFIKAFEGHTHHVLDVGWKGDGKLLASAGADNVIKIWDYEKGEQVRTMNAATKQLTRLQFIGKTAEFVTCSGDGTLRFWNADNGGVARNFSGANDYIYAVGVSPDGKVVAAGGEDGIVRVYNGANGQLLKTLLPPGVKK